MKTSCPAILLACALLAIAGTRVAAQDTTLDRVQNLAATGRFTDAINTLEQWERQFADPRSSATTADRARALFLRGTLSTDAQQAEEAYLGVVLSYPSADVAPHALLRLGQGLLASGEARRAVAYLERLRADYPGSDARETGWLWLARAQSAAGSAGDACRTARDGLGATRSENLRLLLELERDRACATRTSSAPATPSSTSTRAAPPPAAPQFAVQAAAFRERASAEATAAQLRMKGFDARVVTTQGSILYRVRFGSFKTKDDAEDAARRLRTAGFSAMVVSDVAVERVH